MKDARGKEGKALAAEALGRDSRQGDDNCCRKETIDFYYYGATSYAPQLYSGLIK